jgi:hypothetical protein
MIYEGFLFPLAAELATPMSDRRKKIANRA